MADPKLIPWTSVKGWYKGGGKVGIEQTMW